MTIGGNGTLFVGEDKVLKIEVLDVVGVPVNMSGWQILFDVRKSDKSPDPALLSKSPRFSERTTPIEQSTNNVRRLS